MVKNHNLANSVLDASWNRLIQFSTYKALNAGKRVELVDPRGTTQRCSGCGNAVRKSISERVHRCPMCGLVLDRDYNASRNILTIGRGTPELTPAEMRPLLVERPASHVKEACEFIRRRMSHPNRSHVSYPRLKEPVSKVQ